MYAKEVIEAFAPEALAKLQPASKAFIRRAIIKAGEKQETSTALALLQEPAAPRPEQFAELFGSQVSAESVAAAMAARPATVEVHDLLQKADLSSLPSTMLADTAVWQAIFADSEAARKKGKATFTYVDFTARAMLPPWLPVDAVGGKKQKEHLDPHAGTASLQALSCALQSAVAEPREIRSTSQWASVYVMYAPMAIAVRQMTWSMALGYLGTIMKLLDHCSTTARLLLDKCWTTAQTV